MKVRSKKTGKPPARRKRSASTHSRRTYSKTAALPMRVTPELARDTVGAMLAMLFTPKAASLLILVVCVAALAFISLDDRFYVYESFVAGNQYIEATDIIAASDLLGLHVAWVQPERVAQTITKRLPNVRAAWVSCDLMAHCTITVEERQPLFVWQRGRTQVWVDADGIAFAAYGTALDVPVIDASSGAMPLPGEPIDPQIFAGVQALIETMPEVRSLHYTPERGLEFSDPRGGWPVYLGEGSDMSARVTVWRALSDDLARQGLRPAYIDVRYALAPYYLAQ